MKTLKLIALSAVCLTVAPLWAAAPASPPAAETTPVAAKPALPKKGESVTSGLWTFRITITQPGTRSEGTLGELFYDRQTLAAVRVNDYLQTPWGPLYWHGIGVEDSLALWHHWGWSAAPRAKFPAGKLLEVSHGKLVPAAEPAK